MAIVVKQILVKPIQLAEQVIVVADEAIAFKQECAELKSKTEKLAHLLRQAARASSDLFERPTRHIIDDTEPVLEKALALVLKCRAHGLMKSVLIITRAAAFRKMSSQLENSVRDVSWLLRVSAPAEDRGEYLGLPPIALNEPILCLIWEQIAILITGSVDDRSDAAVSLVWLARDNDRYGKLIIEEGGVGPLLKLVKEGKLEGQENAARAIGLLGRDPESVEYMIHAGVCSVFAKILKEGDMKVQAVVAWAVSELAKNYPKCQDLFAQHNIIRLLVSHLAFETIQGHNTEGGPRNATSLHSIVMMSNNSKTTERSIISGFEEEDASRIKDSQLKWESEDPSTKAQMKAMAAKALCGLARGNISICRSISETRAFLCFSLLLEKGSADIKYNCAMVMLAITTMAEQDIDLKRAALKPSSLVFKALVDQLQKIIEKGEPENLIIPCIKVIGNLASTLRGMGIRMISPLVRFLKDGTAVKVSAEALKALAKFASTDNYLHLKHSGAIVTAGGIEHLIQRAYFGEAAEQIPALVLLCYICIHLPSSEEVAEHHALAVVEWALRNECFSDDAVTMLLLDAKTKMVLFRRGNEFPSH